MKLKFVEHQVNLYYQAVLDIEVASDPFCSVHGSQLEPGSIFANTQEATLLLEQLNQLYSHLGTTNLNFG